MTNKQNKQKTTIFSAKDKINSISEPNFTNSEIKVRFGQLKKWSSWRAEKNATKQKVLSFQEVGKKRKMVIKIEFTPLPHRKILPFYKGF